MKILPKQLTNRPFSFKEAVNMGLTKYALERLIEQGVVERIERGIYTPVDYDITTQEGQFAIASIQCGTPSCICLLSALEHYHVTDQIPNKVWVMVPQGKRVQGKNLKLIRARNPQWEIGIQKTKEYWITTLPRTLVDSLLYKNRIGSTVALDALKQALNEEKLKLTDIINTANQLGVKHRIYPYLETLAT